MTVVRRVAEEAPAKQSAAGPSASESSAVDESSLERRVRRLLRERYTAVCGNPTVRLFVRLYMVAGYVFSTVVLVGLPLAWFLGFRCVFTSSVPEGVWQVRPGAIVRGEFVALCYPGEIGAYGVSRGYLAAGNCPGHAQSAMKRVVALPGDRVELSSVGMSVNGELLPHSRRSARDHALKPMRSFVPLGASVVPAGEIWVLGVIDGSWDSRYIGPVAERLVSGVGSPKAINEPLTDERGAALAPRFVGPVPGVGLVYFY